MRPTPCRCEVPACPWAADDPKSAISPTAVLRIISPSPSVALRVCSGHLFAYELLTLSVVALVRSRGLSCRLRALLAVDRLPRASKAGGRGSGMVGYNVQAAVDTTNHLIVAHEVTNVGTDKSHLANMANQAKAALEAENLEAFADRGYFKGEEILACDEAGITVTLPKPQTSEAKSEGRFGKQDFRYVAEEDIYICPAGEKLAHHFTNEENGLVLHHYWTNACRTCALKAQCTKGPQRRIKRWEDEYVVDAVQARLDRNPDAMRTRRETVEHPFGTLKMRMGATHFLMKTLPKVATEMALHVLAYNLTRVMNIVGIKPFLAAIRA